ncbi:hypothetical protein K493DRAFT_297072 [Basidiobolus meristosporus CBS 931.73]|uniref:Uncharacterized protein n=1 Tax=Basidiobolus meristosporus CBS 931.73 TaxID=1314790 RepID=A0A1Y1Z1Y3_9FUNG|nr:hypothetical protein K493DRAFT_297072 [Basidiobolus meristosporus CBS 931.73]|eukprot:ORY04219.1 hypothetical protein K493DRAFT_297072 [Basidiobolus meristosporus CBS 931.73]
MCQDVGYDTIINNTAVAEDKIKGSCMEGYASADAKCFLAIRDMLCASAYRKCDPITRAIYPACPLVMLVAQNPHSESPRLMFLCKNSVTYLDKSVLEKNLDSQAFHNSSDCFAYSSQYPLSGKNPSPSKNEKSTGNDSAPLVLSQDDLELKKPMPDNPLSLPLISGPSQSRVDGEHVKLGDDSRNHTWLLAFLVIAVVGGVGAVGLALFLRTLRQRKLRYKQVWGPTEDPEMKTTTAAVYQARMSREIFVLEDSDESDLEPEVEHKEKRMDGP